MNAANGTTLLKAEVVGADGTFLITPGLAFLLSSPILTLMRSNDQMDARVTEPGGAYSAANLTGAVGNFNLVVATQTPTGSVVDSKVLDVDGNPLILMIFDGPIAGFATVDVYVTAPGADLGPLNADETLSTPGQLVFLSPNTLHPNTPFQVRLTEPGTKNVVANFGANAGIAAEHIHFLLAVHNGANLVTEQFTYDARR